MSDQIPPDLLAKFPEMEAIGQALRQFRRGEPITARCIHCQEPVVVEEIAAVGSLWIHCPCGRTTFRAQRAASTGSNA